jgi:hypothetical protein
MRLFDAEAGLPHSEKKKIFQIFVEISIVFLFLLTSKVNLTFMRQHFAYVTIDQIIVKLPYVKTLTVMLSVSYFAQSKIILSFPI